MYAFKEVAMHNHIKYGNKSKDFKVPQVMVTTVGDGVKIDEHGFMDVEFSVSSTRRNDD